MGCRSQEGLFPLSQGREWTYAVRADLESFVEPVRVTRALAVGGQPGYELSGPLGTSRLVWKQDVLYASQLAGTQFYPEIPILSPRQELPAWKGTVSTPQSDLAAEASLRHSKKTLDLRGRKIPTTLAELTVTSDRSVVVIQTWYEEGVGPVWQEQRTNAKLDRALELLSTKARSEKPKPAR